MRGEKEEIDASHTPLVSRFSRTLTQFLSFVPASDATCRSQWINRWDIGNNQEKEKREWEVKDRDKRSIISSLSLPHSSLLFPMLSLSPFYF